MENQALFDQSEYYKAPTTISRKKKQAARLKKRNKTIKREADRISQLPDDILFSIISYFTVRDAANASVLSFKWRHLCAFLSQLHFDLNSMFQGCNGCYTNFLLKTKIGTCRQYKDIFVRGVNQFLQYYKGSRLAFFSVSFCLEKESTNDIDQWVSFAVSKGVEILYLAFACDNCFVYDKTCKHRNLYTLRAEVLCQGNMAKVQQVYLRSCILGPGVINQFSHLISLRMTKVSLGADGVVETIFSCCLNLEAMCLRNCILIPTLCIPGSLHRLKHLAVIQCHGVEEIKLCAANLSRFEYSGNSHKISFSRAPNLKQVFFRALDARRMQYIFSQLAKDHSSLETLLVYSRADWVQCLPEEITTFSKLKQLELFFPVNIKFDVLKIIAVLKACPLMENFHLVISSVYSQQKIHGMSMPIECGVHKYLKKVHIGGFHFKASYIELALYMLEYGVALERMVLDPEMMLYYGGDAWKIMSRMTWDKGERVKVCSRLQDHPKSSLIIIK